MSKRGGNREGSGRKSKAEEMGLPILIEECIGEPGKRDIITKLFEKAKEGSYLHTQLLMAYMYGKPQDNIDLTSKGEKLSSTIQEVVFRNYGDSGESKA